MTGNQPIVLDASAQNVMHSARDGSLQDFYRSCQCANILDHCEVLIEALLARPEAQRLCGETGSESPGQMDIDGLFAFLKEIFDEIIRRNPDMIFVIAEMGSGVVPIDRHLDCVREQCGRIACELAKEALTVDRMICGCPVRIKG
jgi:adenosyl cobinamide kinase/adenosyl cobinamide phosphate guanylyltransferase